MIGLFRLFFPAVLLLGVNLSIAGLSTATADDIESLDEAIDVYRALTKEDVVESLDPAKPQASETGLAIARPRVDIRVHFDTNSAELSESEKATLSILGLALESSRLAPFSFDIVGHTDAAGPGAYNLKLSRLRAHAVRNYLVSESHVDPDRLQASGVGESELADPNHPRSAVNRRVVIVNLGPSH